MGNNSTAERLCLDCQTDITERHYNAIRCAPCARDRRNRKADRVPSVCQTCETRFIPQHGSKEGKYCSNECYWEGMRRRTRGRTEKACSQCGILKPIDEYNLDKTTADGHRSYCRECAKRMNRVQNLKIYGLTPEEYQAMWDAQQGLCAICKQPATSLHGNNPPVDHDHATGVVREILCGNHNNGIGHFNDDPELLEAAAAYLRKHGK